MEAGYPAASSASAAPASGIHSADAGPFSGTLSDRIATRLPAALGKGILATGLYPRSRLAPRTPISWILMALAVAGLGTVIFISPNNGALMGAAPREQQGIAAGALATARNVGMVLGIGRAGATFNSVLTGAQAHHSHSPLCDAMHWGFLAACGVAALGALVASVRGTQRRSAEAAVALQGRY